MRTFIVRGHNIYFDGEFNHQIYKLADFTFYSYVQLEDFIIQNPVRELEYDEVDCRKESKILSIHDDYFHALKFKKELADHNFDYITIDFFYSESLEKLLVEQNYTIINSV